MPYRRRYRRAPRVRSRSRIPYAVPAKSIVRKFSCWSPVRELGLNGDDENTLWVNNPRAPFRWTAGPGTIGGQPPGLDFWMGKPGSLGPYTTGIPTWAKVKHVFWSISNSPFSPVQIASYWDTLNSPTTPVTPQTLLSRSGVKSRVLLNQADTAQQKSLSRKYDILKILNYHDTGDGFAAGGVAVFDAATDPTFGIYDRLSVINVNGNSFTGSATTSVYCRTKYTVWIHMRLQDDDKFVDSV